LGHKNPIKTNGQNHRTESSPTNIALVVIIHERIFSSFFVLKLKSGKFGLFSSQRRIFLCAEIIFFRVKGKS